MQAGSDSEQESNDGAGTSRKPQKRARGKVQPGNSKPSEPQTASPMAPSGYVGLQLTKKKRTGGIVLQAAPVVDKSCPACVIPLPSPPIHIKNGKRQPKK